MTLTILLTLMVIGTTQCATDADKFTFDLSTAKLAPYFKRDDPSIPGGMVMHMEMDEFVPGNLLFSNTFAIMSTDGTTTTAVTERHQSITGFYQAPGDELLFVDSGPSDCIRSTERIQPKATDFVGRCVADGKATTFLGLCAIMRDNQKEGFALFSNNNGVDHLQLATRDVTTLFRAPGNSIYRPTFLLQDSQNGDIFFASTQSSSVHRFDYKLKTVHTIVQGMARLGPSNPALPLARPYDLQLIDNHRYLLVADVTKCALVLFDAKTGTRKSSLGGPQSCNVVPEPIALLVHANKLYVGGIRGINVIEGSS